MFQVDGKKDCEHSGTAQSKATGFEAIRQGHWKILFVVHRLYLWQTLSASDLDRNRDNSSSRAFGGTKLGGYRKRTESREMQPRAVAGVSEDGESNGASAAQMPNLVEMYKRGGAKGMASLVFSPACQLKLGFFCFVGIRGRFILQIGTYNDSSSIEHLRRPIGCCKNENTGDWIVCDTLNNLVKKSC